MENLESILAEHPFFKELEPKYLQLVLESAKRVRFEADQYISREGDPADFFYLLLEGKVGIEVNIPHRGAITIQTINAGEILGWSWLIPPYKIRLTAKSYGVTHAIALDGKFLRKKCDEDHHLGYEFYKRFTDIIVQRLQASRLQLLDVYGVNS
jgi:CRP-like cAMP-binding protein